LAQLAPLPWDEVNSGADHGAEAVRDAITRTIITLPEELRRSLPHQRITIRR
jgi:ribosomal protein S9